MDGGDEGGEGLAADVEGWHEAQHLGIAGATQEDVLRHEVLLEGGGVGRAEAQEQALTLDGLDDRSFQLLPKPRSGRGRTARIVATFVIEKGAAITEPA